MDAEEKRRLKALGKRAGEQRSREVLDRLRESNSAAIGSDERVRNYKAEVAGDRALRVAPPIEFSPLRRG